MIKKSYSHYLLYVAQMSHATHDNYLRDLIQFENWVKKDLLAVSRENILEYFNDLSKKLSSASCSRKMSALRSFYDYCVSIKEISENPTEQIKISHKEKKLPKYLTIKEMQQLVSFQLNDPEDYLDQAIIQVLFSSGLRVSELISLTVNRYYKQEGFLKIIGKGNKERIVPIHQFAIDSLSEYDKNARTQYNIKMSPYLFINSKSQPLSRQSVYNRLRKRQKEVGLTKDVSPHILRHSFASALINNDADLRVVQELLGHSSISTTQIYTHLESESKKKMYDQFHPGQFLKKGVKNNE